MALKRYAKAIVSKPNIIIDEWMDGIRDQNQGIVSKNHLNRIAKSVLTKCDPNQYLLSHATIVASVDTYAPKNVKLGTQLNRGIQIDVKFPDFRISSNTEHLINNNKDCWSRPLLLSTYRTFVGAPNYLEHIQIPELSKGFIVDAIARDLGDTCYIDILVATDKKHSKLIEDINIGNLSAFSMGCVSAFTICTKCGNVAYDEANLCPCVLYDGKGSKFIDEEGNEKILAEIIGHVSVPGSNQFIEASWVKNPAFAGAVRRNLLNGETDSPHLASKIDTAGQMYELKSNSSIPDGFWGKAASTVRLAEDPPEEPVDDKPEESTESSSNSIDKLLDQAQEKLLQILVDKLSEKLQIKPEDVDSVQPANTQPIDLTSENENLIHASHKPKTHIHSFKLFENRVNELFKNSDRIRNWAISSWNDIHVHKKTSSFSPKSLVLFSWVEDIANHKFYSPDLYKVSMETGKISDFPSEKSYLAVCKTKVSRPISGQEEAFLVRKGRIASLSKVSKF